MKLFSCGVCHEAINAPAFTSTTYVSGTANTRIRRKTHYCTACYGHELVARVAMAKQSARDTVLKAGLNPEDFGL